VDVDLNACINGSKQAWDHFVRTNSRLIYAAVQRAFRGRGGNQSDVDDRVQDVFVRLIQNDFRLLKTFDPGRASLSTWLTLVARSIVHEHLRKRALHTTALLPNQPDTQRRSTAFSHGCSIVDDPSLPLQLLTERQRLVLQMLFDEGMSVEDAAGRIGVDPQTIRSTKHKALTRLRQELPDPRTNGDA